MKIKKLPSNLIDKIAAGEVVERPASVVKELVENALDADASFVDVEVVKGGKDSILVRDDGLGMGREDAREAFKRHATSKLSSVEDLTSIATFGFRGEALSSIAAVSDVVLQTKEAQSVEGTEVSVSGGKVESVTSCAHPEGTTVKVSDLFYNIPARRKFLKSTRTEFKHIRDWLVAQALANSKVGFSLAHNDADVLHFPAGQTREQRIEKAVGSLEDFVPVLGDTDYIRLSGFVAVPRKARKRRKNQYLFVNGRYLGNKTVSGALRKAYSELLPSSLHPPYVLFLNIREDLVDVNVHPRKEEIKFINSSDVYRVVLDSVRSALSKGLERKGAGFSVQEQDFGGGPTRPKQRMSKSRRGEDLFSGPPGKTRPNHRVESVDFLEKIRDEEAELPRSPIPQIANLYLLVVGEDGFFVVDQHAAEERILLEEFLSRYQKQKKEGLGQGLLVPITFELDGNDFRTLKENKETLEKLGFDFDFNGRNKVSLAAVPTVLVNRDIETIFYGFLDDLSEDQEFEGGGIEIAPQVYKLLATLACRSAVKKGDRLSFQEKQNIINRLEDLGARGATCPHGRPTRIRFPLSRLNKMFKRS